MPRAKGLNAALVGSALLGAFMSKVQCCRGVGRRCRRSASAGASYLSAGIGTLIDSHDVLKYCLSEISNVLNLAVLIALSVASLNRIYIYPLKFWKVVVKVHT